MPVQKTKTSFTGPGFQHMSYLAFANITELLGMPALATKYRAKASAIVDAVNAKFFNASTGAYSASGSGKLDASQCGQGMALFMDFVPETHRAKALAVMADNARDTAYIAAPGTQEFFFLSPSSFSCLLLLPRVFYFFFFVVFFFFFFFFFCL